MVRHFGKTGKYHQKSQLINSNIRFFVNLSVPSFDFANNYQINPPQYCSRFSRTE